ncbi:hypothetical protein Hypma_016232 [Hypsizygus marmoreus]|uniref:Fe2OG dioxygenase domain-containing protein n=1 Tax=Hypsizygus marmoreus TaxID=39966 RepID=A0A369IYG0_HYPMA|nr:hypothetical protein Hypma_016232 [Hypsizygus marmoreus]
MASSHSINASLLGQSSNIEVTAAELVETDMEDEVDQLDSDSDAGGPEIDVSGKQNGLASGVRVPGHSLLPAVRLENIIQADGVTGNLALSKEGLFILSVATEEFIKRMAEAGQLKASSERRTSVNYSDMAATTQQYQEFMFLHDTIPVPIPLSEALQLREAKEKELIDEEPPAPASRPFRPSISISSSASAPPKTKAKSRSSTTNGQDKRNGSSSTTSRRERRSGSGGQRSSVGGTPDVDVTREGPWSEWAEMPGPRSTSGSVLNGRSSISTVARPSPLANGHSSVPSRSGTLTPARSREESSEHASPRHCPPPPARSSPLAGQEEAPWPGQYTGPASGFLQGPGGPFGHVAQNPGRILAILSVSGLSYLLPVPANPKIKVISQCSLDPPTSLCGFPFATTLIFEYYTMSPAKANGLPIIDIAPFLNDDPAGADLRGSTAAALHKACVEYGFFYLDISKYADRSVPEHLTDLAREFFALPQEEKDKLAMKNQDHARGYARLKENVTNGKADNHEGLDIYRPVENPDKSKPLWGENQWPSVPGFMDRYEAWVEKMKALGLIVMRAMALGLGMSTDEWNELRKQVDDSFWVMRVIGYPPLPNDYDGFSCGAHKDYGCLTFLYADPTPSALQVFSSRPGAIEFAGTDLVTQGSEKGVWLNADPIPGCVVCNIGEMWEIWSNGLYRSTLHQVVHRGSNYRVSIPFFFEPNFDAHIKPLAAALRLQEAEGKNQPIEPRRSVVYGDFLLAKVGSNFEFGKGKYDN